MKSRRFIIIILSFLAILAALYGWQRDNIARFLFDRAVEGAVGRNMAGGLDPDGIHVAFCGTGSPLPARDRAEACTAIIAGGRMFIFDMGEGGGRTLAQMGLPLDNVAGIWLTHLHSDHFEGLGAFSLQRWAGTSAETPLALYGPTGVEEIAAGLTQAFRIDSTYRIAHHGEAVVPPTGFGFAAEAVGPGIVHDQDGVRITAFAVDHSPVSPAYGYRLDYKGHSVTLTGDTADSPVIAEMAKGSDLLISEILNPDMVKTMADAARSAGNANRAKIFTDIQDYHITPEQAADAARKGRVKMLAFTHVVPSVPAIMEKILLRRAPDHYDGPIEVMHDGDLISISGTGAISQQNLLP